MVCDGCGVEFPGVDHGECIRGGSSWYVKMDAMMIPELCYILLLSQIHMIYCRKDKGNNDRGKERVTVWE